MIKTIKTVKMITIGVHVTEVITKLKQGFRFWNTLYNNPNPYLA